MNCDGRSVHLLWLSTSLYLNLMRLRSFHLKPQPMGDTKIDMYVGYLVQTRISIRLSSTLYSIAYIRASLLV